MKNRCRKMQRREIDVKSLVPLPPSDRPPEDFIIFMIKQENSMQSSDEITASFDKLQDDAQSTATTYLGTAKRRIDELFGPGYAAENPLLVAAFMQCAASDLNAATTAKVMSAAIRALGSGLDNVANALRNAD